MGVDGRMLERDVWTWFEGVELGQSDVADL